MKKAVVLGLGLSLIGVVLWVGIAGAQGGGDVVTGGLLYDKWWTVAPGATEPTGDQALWATQTTNTRSGADTWRCKECHGWDYKGKDGAYGSGSHMTGFGGVYAAQSKTVDELAGILKGVSSPQHDFSSVLDDNSINQLAQFLRDGLVDMSQYVDYETKKAKGGDVAHGQQLYASTCVACHGEDGTTLNFHDEAEPEFVGTIANDNPWEFLHKVRFGQPAEDMVSGVALGWSAQDATDVLAYAQTLPTAPPQALPTSGGTATWPGLILVLGGLAAVGSGLLVRSRVRSH